MRGSSTSMTGQLAPVQPVGQPRGGDRGDRRGIVDHEPDPRRRQRRVDRQIRRPGLEHRQNRHDRLSATGKTAAPHTAPGPHHIQSASAPTGSTPHRARGTSSSGPRKLSATASGARATCAANNTGTDTDVAGSVNTARLPISSSRACSPASSRSTDDNRPPSGRRSSPPTPARTARSAPRCWPRRTRRCGTPPSRRSRRAHRPRSSVRPTRTPDPWGRCGCPPAAG